MKTAHFKIKKLETASKCFHRIETDGTTVTFSMQKHAKKRRRECRRELELTTWSEQVQCLLGSEFKESSPDDVKSFNWWRAFQTNCVKSKIMVIRCHVNALFERFWMKIYSFEFSLKTFRTPLINYSDKYWANIDDFDHTANDTLHILSVGPDTLTRSLFPIYKDWYYLCHRIIGRIFLSKTLCLEELYGYLNIFLGWRRDKSAMRNI